MAAKSDSSMVFFSKGTPAQWAYVLSLYKEVLKLRAEDTRGARKNGPQDMVKLDTWYQEVLPVTINQRKERHVLHDELVQITKWKLMRNRPKARLLDLVRTNTELAVAQASKKAFKKLPNLQGAIHALTNLKGISPATASAVIAAGAPEHCPYMADECLLATPGVEPNDFSIADCVNYADQIKLCTERLTGEDPDAKWNPHKVELCLWTHYLARQLNPSLLDDMPMANGAAVGSSSVDEAIPKSEDVSDDGSNISSTREVDHAPATNGTLRIGRDPHHNHLLASEEDSNVSLPNSEFDDKSNDSLLRAEIKKDSVCSSDSKEAFENHSSSEAKNDNQPTSESESSGNNEIMNLCMKKREEPLISAEATDLAAEKKDEVTKTSDSMVSDINPSDSIPANGVSRSTNSEVSSDIAETNDEPQSKKLRTE